MQFSLEDPVTLKAQWAWMLAFFSYSRFFLLVGEFIPSKAHLYDPLL